MTRKIVVALLACCTLIAGLTLVKVHQAQAEAAGISYSYITPITRDPVSLSGLSASQQTGFELPRYWNVSEVKVSLDYGLSQIVKNYISSFTLSVNGSKFYSFRPALSETGTQRLTVSVPVEYLVAGVNTLRLEGHLRTTTDEEGCANDLSPDNWLTIREGSAITAVYTKLAPDGSIGDFFRRFTGIDTIAGGKSQLTLQAGPGSAEWESAVYALSGLARQNSLSDKQIPLLPYRMDTLTGKELVVAVGLVDRLPQELRSQLAEADWEKQAVIQLVLKETRPTLVITSRNESLLIQAGRFVGNQKLMDQLAEDRKIIEEQTDVAAPAPSVSKTVTFTDQGDTLRGSYHQEQSYYVALPSNRSVANASKISLDYRYSQNLDFNRSMVTVWINNTPIGSKKLAKELANGDKAVFPVPNNLAVSGNFSVRVAFDLELANASCAPQSEDMPWAFITKDSQMQLNTKDKTELLFNNYPYPFLRDGQYNQVAVVMPREQDDLTFLTVSNLFNLLGRYAESNMGEVRFLSDNAGEAELKDRNIIALGAYGSNAVLRGVNKELYFKFDESGTRLLSNEKLSLESGYGQRVGTLQLIDSPYGSGRALLAVTGAQTESAFRASALLANEQSRYRVYGDGVITDRDGNINAYRFKLTTGQPRSSIIDTILQRNDVVNFTAVAVLLLLLTMVSLILLIRKHTRKRGGRS